MRRSPSYCDYFCMAFVSCWFRVQTDTLGFRQLAEEREGRERERERERVRKRKREVYVLGVAWQPLWLASK